MEIRKRVMRRSHRAVRRVVVFTNHYPLIGPILWILSIQYLVTSYFVSVLWPRPYDWANNFISDLGNTTCGIFNERDVCSPAYFLMNLSFIVFGITIAIGAGLIYTEFKRTRLSLIGFMLMCLVGIGTIGIGIFPENVFTSGHLISASMALGLAGVSIVVLSFGLHDVGMPFRVFTFVSGCVSFGAFLLLVSDVYLGLGAGGMERASSYSFTIWLMMFGMYMSAVRIRARQANRG